MPFDTYNFLVVGLTGFVTVWTFRKYAGSKEKLDSFEYLGISAFWGLVVLCTSSMLLDDKGTKAADEMFKNPYVSGFVMSLLGGAAGGISGLVTRLKPLAFIKKLIKKD